MGTINGKQRLTDAATAETLLRLVQSVPSPKAEPIKRMPGNGQFQISVSRLRRLNERVPITEKLPLTNI